MWPTQCQIDLIQFKKHKSRIESEEKKCTGPKEGAKGLKRSAFTKEAQQAYGPKVQKQKYEAHICVIAD